MKYTTPLIIVVGIIILAGLFFLLKPKTENSKAPVSQSKYSATANPTPVPSQALNNFELIIKNKKLASGPSSIQIFKGGEVQIKVTSDLKEQFHLHGYDKSLELEPNKPGVLKFKADVSGKFPFELENSGVDLGTLEVLPKP